MNLSKMISAASCSLVVGPLRAAFVKHLRVGGVHVELGEGHAVLTTDLTEALVHGVGEPTIVGHGASGVEEFHDVNILGRELSRVDIEFAKETTSFPEGSHVSTAHPRSTVTGLLASVDPSILLGHSHNILNSHVLRSGEGSLLRDLEAGGAKTFVHGLGEEDVDSVGDNLLKD